MAGACVMPSRTWCDSRAIAGIRTNASPSWSPIWMCGWPNDPIPLSGELAWRAPRYERKDETLAGLFFSTTLMVLLIPCRADAFIFTDLVAQAQRITMIEQAAQHLEHIDSYRKEFDKYKKEFDKYFLSFRRVYRRLSSADWGDFNPSNWGRLKD